MGIKRKLVYGVLSIMVSFSFILTGCGTKQVTSDIVSEQKEINNVDENSKTKKEDEQITLRIMSSIQTETEAPLEKKMAEDYMKLHPNIKIEFIPEKINGVTTKIIALNSSGDLPDAFVVPLQFQTQAKSMGILLNAEKYLDEEFVKSLDENVKEAVTIDGEMITVPWAITPQALIYRTDWLKEAGMDTIETMDDFVKAAKAFTNGKDRWGFSLVGTQNGSGQGRFLQFVNSFGVREVYKDESGKWKSELTSDAYRDCLKFFVDLDLVEGVVPPGATETGYPEACTAFAQEKTGLLISASNAIGVILGQNPELKGKIGSVPTPKKMQHCSAVAVGGYGISKSCKYPEEMAKYLEFIASPENSITYAKASGRLPVTADSLKDPMFNEPIYKGFIDAVQYAIPQPTFKGNSEIWDIVGESYNSMLSGVSLEDAMNRVETRVDEVLKKYEE